MKSITARSFAQKAAAIIAPVAIVLASSGFAQASLGQDTYEARSAQEKQEILWDNMVSSEYQQLPEWTGFEGVELLLKSLNPIKIITRTYLNVTMERNSDFMPEGRKKPIHTYGSTAKIEFIADAASPYTGLYQGTTHGIARLSLAAKPKSDNTIPGLAIKMLVDGQPSLNFMAMYSLDGQPTYNFFENSFSNSINPPKSLAVKLLAGGFQLVTRDATKVDTAYLANMSQSGEAIAKPVAPEKLVLVPNKAVLKFDDAEHEVRNDLDSIVEGTTLYYVYGSTIDSNDQKYIGRIVTSSRFVSSQFGDEQLFFRHQRFNNR